MDLCLMSSNHMKGDDLYIGNIWGWKWSLISLVIIVFFLLMMYGRYRYLVATDAYKPVQDTIQVHEN